MNPGPPWFHTSLDAFAARRSDENNLKSRASDKALLCGKQQIRCFSKIEFYSVPCVSLRLDKPPQMFFFKA